MNEPASTPPPDPQDPGEPKEPRAPELEAIARLLGGTEEPQAEVEAELELAPPEPEPEFKPAPTSRAKRRTRAKRQPETQPSLAFPTPPAEREPRVAGRFEVLGPMGEGPHGRVFRAHDHAHSGRDTALKILRAKCTGAPGFEARLGELLSARKRLKGTRVNRLRQVGRTDLGLYYLAADPVTGENLRALLNRRGPLHPRHAFEIVRQVAMGLQEGHAFGFVHGGVHDCNVFLVERVPSTDSNPFGVEVRLTDFGLATILPKADEEKARHQSVQDDLRELGWLLVELLSGTRADPQGPGWEAATAVHLSPAALEFVARSVGGEDSFESATELLTALERLPEWRGPNPHASRWRTWALASTALCLAFAGQFLWSTLTPEDVRAAGPGHAEDVPSVELEELREALRQKTTELGASEASRSELGAEAARAREQAHQATSLSQQQEQSLTALGAEVAAWRQRAEGGESMLKQLRGEASIAEGRVEALEASLRHAEAALAGLETEKITRARAADPNWRAAHACDRLLSAVEGGDVAGAQAILEQLRSEAPFDRVDLPGTGFLRAWLTATAGVASVRATRAPIPRAEMLRAAESTLARAADRIETFVADASGWLDLGQEVPAPSSGTSRLDRIEGSLSAARGALARERDALEPLLVSAWKALEVPSLDRAPGEVVSLAAWFDDDRLDSWITGYAELLVQGYGAEGRLDLEALAELTFLDAWADAVTEDDAFSASLAGREIRLLRYARRFHDPARADEALPPYPIVHQGQSGGGPISGWRATLELKARLAAGELPYPAAIGTRTTWVTRTPEGSTSYVIETVFEDSSPPPDAVRSCIVEQRFYDASGEKRGDRRVRVVQRGKRFYEEGARQKLVFDLSLNWGFSIRYWTPRECPPMPERLPVNADSVARFQKTLMERGWSSLVFAAGERTTWCSSAYGLVRDADPSRIERELVLLEQP